MLEFVYHMQLKWHAKTSGVASYGEWQRATQRIGFRGAARHQVCELLVICTYTHTVLHRRLPFPLGMLEGSVPNILGNTCTAGNIGTHQRTHQATSSGQECASVQCWGWIFSSHIQGTSSCQHFLKTKTQITFRSNNSAWTFTDLVKSHSRTSGQWNNYDQHRKHYAAIISPHSIPVPRFKECYQIWGWPPHSEALQVVATKIYWNWEEELRCGMCEHDRQSLRRLPQAHFVHCHTQQDGQHQWKIGSWKADRPNGGTLQLVSFPPFNNSNKYNYS